MIIARFRLLLLILVGLTVTACGGSDSTGPGNQDPDPNPPADPVPASVEVTPLADSLSVNETLQLDAEVKDASGTVLAGEAVTWSSSDDALATVSSTGEVTAVAAGAVQITATAGSVSGSADLSVFTALDEITDAGGTVASSDGRATLEVPAGALGATTAITVSPTDAGAVAVGAVPGSAYDFGPDGLAFTSPATMTLAYDADSLPAGADESALVLVRFDGATLERLNGAVVDPAAATVSAQVPGFSSFAVCLPSQGALCGASPDAEVDLVVEELGTVVLESDPIGQGTPSSAPVALYQGKFFDIRNDGTAPATGVELSIATSGELALGGLSIDFPSDDDPEEAVMSCADAGTDADGAVTAITCSLPPIPAGETLLGVTPGELVINALVPYGTTSLAVEVSAASTGEAVEAAPGDNALGLDLPYFDTPGTDLTASLSAPQEVVEGEAWVLTLAVENVADPQAGPQLDGIRALVQLDGVNFGQDLPAQCGLDPDLGSLSAVRCVFSGLEAGDVREFDFELSTGSGPEIVADAVVNRWTGAVDTDATNNTDQSTTVVAGPVTDIAAAMVASREPVEVGDTLTYTLTLTNEGPDDLPGGLAALTASGPVDYPADFATPQGCSLGSGGTGIGVSCSIGALTPGASATFRLRAQATGGGEILATGGPFQLTSSTDPNVANDTARVTTTVNLPEADLEYSLSSDPASLNGGEPATFTFRVVNPGGTDAEGVDFLLTIFGDVSTAASWSVPAGCELGTPVPGGAQVGVRCRPVTVPAGGAVSREVTVDIAPDETSLRLLGSIVDVGTVTDPVATNNEIDETVPVTPAPTQTDLAIDYSLNPTDPVAGGEVAATITVSNLGGADAAEVVWVLNFNNGVSVASGYTAPAGCQLGTPADPSVDGTGLLCSGVSVPAGGSASETLTLALADTTSVIEIIGGIQDAGTVEDTNGANNSISETVTVQAAGQDPFIVLDPESISFDVVEGGTAPAAVLVAILNGGGGTLVGLDVGVASYGAGQPTGWLQASYFNDGQNDLVVVQANQDGLTQGTYTANIQVFDTQASNSPVDLPVVLNVLPAADVGIAVVNVPATVDVGTTIDYEVTVTNDGPADAAEVIFTLAVSGTLLSPGPSFTPQGCTLFTSPEGAPPAKLYQCTIPTLASGASQTFTLPLIPQVSGEELGGVATVQSFDGAADPNPANDIAVTESTVN